MRRRPQGFTLIELMVVIIIIGILAAIGIPQYMTSVENSKADSGVALLRMVAAANQMYKLDNGNYVATGQIRTGAPACSCTPGPCTFATSDLVGCNYLPTNDYDNMSYTVQALNAGGAQVARRAGGGTYVNWGYSINANGQVSCLNPGAVACGGTNPPAPPQ